MKFQKIDIIIPTFNRPEKIIETLKSIQETDYPKESLNVYVIDDNSTTDLSLLKEFIGKCKMNVRLLKTPQNLGPSFARNLGVKKSKSRFVFFTDDDCLVPKNIFKTQIDFFKKHPEVYGIGGELIPKKKNFYSKVELFKDNILGISNREEKIGKGLQVGYTCNMIYKREVFEKCGFFNEEFKVPAGEDKEFKERVEKKFDLAFLPIKVIHNHDYDFSYILSILYKQGLDKMKPQDRNLAIAIMIFSLPLLLLNILKKTFFYRVK
ncbi:MAG: glycosyltransferase family A protein [archaeon]|nr:glycosyltransferase family A protein [archaeon]